MREPSGPCLCGAPDCPSCGPAQGYPPQPWHVCRNCGGMVEYDCDCEEPEPLPAKGEELDWYSDDIADMRRERDR